MNEKLAFTPDIFQEKVIVDRNQFAEHVMKLVENNGNKDKKLHFFNPKRNPQSLNIDDKDILIKIVIKMIATSQRPIDWTIFSSEVLNSIKAEIAVNLSLKDAFSNTKERKELMHFLKKFYSSLEHPHILKIALGYTSIPIALRFSRLTVKDMLLNESEIDEEEEGPSIIETWKKMSKIANKLYENPKSKFLHSLMNDFWEINDDELYRPFIEFLIILVSQEETMVYVKYLIKDSLFILRVKRSKIYKESLIIRQLIESLQSYLFEKEELVYKNLSLLKELAHKYFPEELASSSTNQQNESGSLVGKSYLQKAMENVSYSIVHRIAQQLRINTFKVEELDKDENDRRDTLVQLIGEKLESKNIIQSGESVENTPSFINEKEFYDESDTTIPVILNYSSLDIMDYSYKLFHDSRRSLVDSIRKQVNYLTDNINPQFGLDNKFDGYEGWNKDAAPLNYSRILTIKQPKIA